MVREVAAGIRVGDQKSARKRARSNPMQCLYYCLPSMEFIRLEPLFMPPRVAEICLVSSLQSKFYSGLAVIKTIDPRPISVKRLIYLNFSIDRSIEEVPDHNYGDSRRFTHQLTVREVLSV